MKKYFFIFIIIFTSKSFAIDVPTVDDYENKINKSKEIEKNLIIDKEKKQKSSISTNDENQIRVKIKKFIIEGNYSIAESELQDIIKEFLNKDLTLAELDATTEFITNYYIDQGLWARAVLPEQDINNNELKIKVIEAKLGKIIFQKSADSKFGISEKRAQKYLNKNQFKDKIFNINNLNKNVQRLDNLAGINATASLQSGEIEGETDVIVEVSESELVSGNVKADNHGSRSSGFARSTSLVNFNGLFNLGETLTFQNVHTAGSDFYSVGLTIPIGYSGLTTTIKGSEMDYDLGTPLKSSNADGNSDSLSMTLDFPSFNLKNLTGSISLGLSNNTYLNRTVSGISSEKKNFKSNIDFNFNLSDSLFGGGSNSLSFSIVSGELDLGDTPSNLASDQTTANTNGNYDKFTFNFSRVQSITNRNSILFSTNGQYGGKNLDSGEQISLGGVSGVKSFPNSEASGSHGIISKLEHQYIFNQRIRSKIFYDFGKIQQYKNTYSGWNSSNTSLKNSYDLSGAGVGLDIFLGDLGDLSMVYSQKFSGNPANDAFGKDNDGTDHSERLWLSLSKNF
tara:strand:- start:770 stop:2470 length:1701 start_codon:yes stop_codon:yes gene_type:complete